MADEGTALDMAEIDRLMGAWIESVEYAPERFLPGDMPDIDDAELMEKGDRSAAGRKAALARWGNRAPVNDAVRAKRSDAARRAAATRRAKREAAASAGPETEAQAIARMGKEMESKRYTGEPIDAIGEIAARDDYRAFITRNRLELGLSRDEADILSDACLRIREGQKRQESQYQNATGHVRQRIHENATEAAMSGEVMTATPYAVALRILGGERCKSQFETQRSGGLLSPETRAEQETAMFRIHPGVNVAARPTYGYVSNGMPTSRGPSQYGDIRFALSEKVASRATVTIGDSLGSAATPIPMRKTPTERQASDSQGWTSLGAQAPLADIQRTGYVEAQVPGGWGREDVTRIYVPRPTASDDTAVEDAARSMGIPVEYYD